MITYAQIHHYKSISEAELRLKSINVIVGPNGSGKSNILDALYFLHDCVTNDVDTAITRRHGIDSLRQWSRTRPYNITIELKFKNENGTGNYKTVISSNRGTFRILEEAGTWSGPSPLRSAPRDKAARNIFSSFKRTENGDISYSSDAEEKIPEGIKKISPEELFLSYVGVRFAVSQAMYFKHVYNELSSFAKYNIYPNTLRNPQIISKESMLDEDGSNLSSVLKKMNTDKRTSSQKENLIESLRTIMSNIVDIHVRSAGGYYVPVIRVREDNNDIHDFNLSQISDGTLRTLGLLTAFYQPSAPQKVGIEEPELMIHPGALNTIREAMESFVVDKDRKNRQIFITTHSPTLIDLFEPEDIIWAKLVRGLTTCDHIRQRQLDVIKKQLFSAGELLIAEGLF
jgi:predicted ATPase